MSSAAGPTIPTSNLVLDIDMSNTQKSWLGAPTINRVVTVPLPLGTYAYATGPVSTVVSDADFNSRTINRYTISQLINTARAAIYLPNGSLALSTPYAFSCVWRYNGSNTTSPVFDINASKGNPEGANNTFSSLLQTNTVLANGWTYSKLEFTLATSPTLGCYLTFGIVTGTDTAYLNNTFDVYNVQFEQNTYATPFVNGTRTSNRAIVDLTGNTIVTATSLTYASDNTFSFNGSNYISIPSVNLGNGNVTWSVSAWIKTTTTTNVLGGGSVMSNSSGGPVYSMMGVNNGKIVYWTYQSGWIQKLGVKTVNDNIWHMLTWVNYSNSTMDMYVDGILDTNIANSTSGNNNPIDRIGGSWAAQFVGSISSVQLYFKALSAAEVQQNFNALRGRYGI